MEKILFSFFKKKLKKTYFIENNRLHMQQGSIPLNNVEHKLEKKDKVSTLWIKVYNINSTDFEEYYIRFHNTYLDHFKEIEKNLNRIKN